MKKFVSPMALALVLAACGGEDPGPAIQLECGPGTVLTDGTCERATRTCPEGQVLTPIGSCLAPSVYCGTGSTYDTATESCVSTSEIRCGEGTVQEGGRCVVEDPLRCGPRTVLADGECALAESVCGPGTDLDELECLPGPDACASGTEFDVITRECVDLEVVTCGASTVQSGNRCIPTGTFADELAAQATVDFSSTNRTLPVGNQVGDQVIFTGTFTSSTQLFHIFPMQNQVGQWVRVQLYPRGLPSVGLRVNHAFSSWERIAPPGLFSAPERTMALQANSHDLIVSTAVSGLPTVGPFPTTGWSYVGVVEVVERPETILWDLQDDLKLDLDTPAWVRIQIPAGGRAIITPSTLGADLDSASLEVWNSPTSFDRANPLSAGGVVQLEGSSTQATTKYILLDAQTLRGTRTELTLSARETTSIAPGQAFQETLVAEAGQVLRLAHTNDGNRTLTLEVIKDSTLLYTTTSSFAANRTSYNWNQARRDFFLAPESGEYTVRYLNPTTTQVQGFYTTHTVEDVQTFALADEGLSTFEETIHAQNLTLGDWTVMVINTPVSAFVDADFTAGQGFPYITIYDANRDVIAQNITSSSSKSLDFDLPSPGSYVIAYKSGSSFTQLSNGVATSLSARPTISLEPGESLTQTYDASVFDVLRGAASVRSGQARLRLLNPVGDAVIDEALTSSRHLLELLPANGTFTLEIANESSATLIDPLFAVEWIHPVSVLDRSISFSEFFQRTTALADGESEYYLVRLRSALVLNALANATAATLRWFDFSQPTSTPRSASGEDEIEFEVGFFGNGTYLLQVQADAPLSGYDLSFFGEESQFGENSVTSTPGLAIPDSNAAGVNDTINISSCAEVLEIDMDINITHTWRGDLIIRLTSPDGTQIPLKARFGSSTDNIIGNFNDTLNASTGFGTVTAQPISNFEGTLGTGTWTLNVSDNAFGDTGTLNSWTLNLFCVI